VTDRSAHPDGPTHGTYRATDDGSLPARGQADTPFNPAAP
jgi:hypothetical protein